MKQLKQVLIFGILFAAGVCLAEVENLRCEYLTNPWGIDATEPRLSWILTSNRKGEKQTAYQILAASSRNLLNKDQGDLWDSGKVVSDESTQIRYAGLSLTSRQSCFWKVRIWDGDGIFSRWSPIGQWQMGLLHREDWSAKWVAAEAPATSSTARLIIHRATYGDEKGEDAADVTSTLASYVKQNCLTLVVNNKTLGADPAHNRAKHLRVDYEFEGQPGTREVRENETLMIPEELARLPYLRKSFELSRPIKSAVLYATALGLYEIHINGRRVGDYVIAPDWTDYRKRVRYQAYDVTALLKNGQNAMAAILANGWYSGHIGNGGFQFFGKTPALLAQLEVTYSDGRSERIVTDESWKTAASPILSSDFMAGEDYDARREVKGWDEAGLDERQWVPVKVREEPPLLLQSQVMQPVRELCE